MRVVPGAKKSKVETVSDASYKVWTTAAPEKGKANKAVIALLAKHLGIKKSELTLSAGLTSKEKVFERTDNVCK